MLRTANVRLELDIRGRTNMVFSMTPAIGAGILSERLDFSIDGQLSIAREMVDVHGTRLHTFVAEKGRMVVDYFVEVAGRAAVVAVDERDLVTYLRPSRYCESDTLTPTARALFAGLEGYELVVAVVDWIWSHIAYVGGSSRSTDGAVQTLLLREGVCRDFAHVAIALLRAMEVPARMVAVYAPGLSPMDFHAVVEAWVDDAWWVVDPSRLAPRQSLLRISTGRDAADTAWLTSNWTDLAVASMSLTVIADELPNDDGSERVQLG